MLDTTFFWNGLPGPSRFLEQAAERLLNSSQGLLGIAFPAIRPAGIIEALVEKLRDQGGGRIIKIRADEALFDRSIAHGIARAAGVLHGNVSSLAALIDAPEMAAVTFVVDGISKVSWPRWLSFLRSFAVETGSTDRTLAPNIAVFLPADLPRRDVEFLFGRDEVIWRGVITPIDTRLLVSRLMPSSGSESLAERIAAEVVIRVAGWDLQLAAALCEQPTEVLLNPIGLLKNIETEKLPISWGAGTVDEWDGEPFVQSLASLASGDLDTVQRRIWWANSTAVLPFIGEVIEHYCSEHRELLRSKLPYSFVRGEARVEISEMDKLEIGNLYHLLIDDLPQTDVAVLKYFLNIRNRVAHHRLPEASHVMAISEAWDRIKVASARRGSWSWPRCGQKLSLVMGDDPDAPRDDGEVLSPSLIRLDMWDGKDDVDDRQLAAEIKRRIGRILCRGDSAILHITDFDKAVRLSFVDLVPRDMKVVYEIVNMPPGWVPPHSRALVAANAPIDSKYVPYPEYDEILAGDGRPHIVVVDRRVTSSAGFLPA